MKKFLALLLFVTTAAFAFDSTSTYNSANMSYPANSTISQFVVFNSAMQAGGDINFTVDAHGGGGRPLQHDTGQLRLEFYNGGSMIGFAQTNFPSGNLPQMDAWSSAPGDNSAPWQTLTLSTSTCGSAGSCANVTHMKVIMIGTDTSWWAGNYGPQWRVPSVTFNSGNNILYNPEFGTYGNTMAQGWASSSGWGACGTTSGSVMCTTTAPGVTANMSGGGYSATGGTTGGTAGGYSSTLVPPTVVASGGGSGGTTAPTFDGTITQVNAPTSNNNYNSDPISWNTQQQNRADAWQTRVLSNGATIVLDVNGSNNTLYIEQVGNKNLVTGIGETPARVTGSSNTVTVKQGTIASGQNEIDLRVIGNNNSLNIGQARTSTGTETGVNGHYQAVDINGYQNTMVTQQSNTTLGGHYQETTVNGNQNSITARQTDNGNKIMFNTVTGSGNTLNATQQGTGQHSLAATLTGNNHLVTVLQEGTSQNKANIDLTNAGGAATIDLIQSGGKNFTIQQSCTNPAGCSTTIRQ